jgi:hypothetical protein
MALHSKKDFCKLCGIESKHISTLIKRNNIIETKDGYFDDADPVNNSFILKKQDKKQLNGKSEEAPAVELNNGVQKESGGGKKGKQVGGTLYDLDVEKKGLEIEKLKVDTRLQELKEDKIKGEVVPIVIVKQIVNALTQSVLTSQKDFIEDMLINVSKEYRLSGTQLAKLRGKMVKGLNEGMDKAIDMTKRNVKSLVDEFSIKKEVGERE